MCADAKRNLAVNTFAHLCVDFCCLYVLFAGVAVSLSDSTAASLFLVYNIIAFGLQPFIGYLCDLHRAFPASALGCILIATALVLLRFPVPALLLAAFGNALFHVGGGSDTLLGSDGSIAPNGMFVSSGALGVALGTLCGKSGLSLTLPLLLILLSLMLLLLCRRPTANGCIRTFSLARQSAPFGMIMILALLAVIVRAFIGTLLHAVWADTAFLSMLPALSSCLGKAFGGWLSDRLGARRVCTVALFVSIPLLCLFGNQPLLYCIGLFCFNVPMAVTLCLCGELLPGHPGFAFGLITLGLLLGTLPGFFIEASGSAVPILTGILTFFAALCIVIVAEPGRQTLPDKQKRRLI